MSIPREIRRCVILGGESSWYVADLLQAAERAGISATRASFEQLGSCVDARQTIIHAGDINLTDCDAVLVRTMPPGSLEQVVYRMDALQTLERQGVIVLNSPRAIECAVDKFLTTTRLAAAGLPTPATIVCETWEQALAAQQELGGDVVVKPLFGAEGRGIVRVSDPDLGERVFKTLSRVQSVLYLQEFVPHSGQDLRLLVLNGAVLSAVSRTNPHDFRTNAARDAIVQPHAPTSEEVDAALAATAATGAWFAGIDLLYHPARGLQVIEVNAVPGWRALQRATGCRVAEHVISALRKLEQREYAS